MAQTLAGLRPMAHADPAALAALLPLMRQLRDIKGVREVKPGIFHCRGVAFVREFVPGRLVAWMARALYNEPYRRAPMSSAVTVDGDRITVKHRLTVGGRAHTLTVRAEGPPTVPPPDSRAHFFKEHAWGFGHSRRGRLLTYEVRHPVWAVWRAAKAELDWDWGAVYGPEWAALNGVEPASVVLAEGSEIAVAPKRLGG